MTGTYFTPCVCMCVLALFSQSHLSWWCVFRCYTFHRALLVICCVARVRRVSKCLVLKGATVCHKHCFWVMNLSPSNALCNNFSGSQSFSVLASVVMKPPAEIVTFHHAFVSNVHTWPPPPHSGRVLYCSLGKITNRHLKTWTGCWCARLFNLLKMIWMLGYHWSVADTHEPCFCCKWECSMGRAVWHTLAHCNPQLSSGMESVLLTNVRYFYSFICCLWPSNCSHGLS